MGLLLTLDPARRTGWCLCEPWKSGRPRMECGSFELPSDATIQERLDHMQAHLRRLVKGRTIEYVGIEIPNADVRSAEVVEETDMGPMKRRKVFGSIKTVTQLWAYHGCVVGIICAFGFPYRAEVARTWRAAVWKGSGNMKKADAIERCREVCHRFDISAPNDDARTAAAMMFWLNGGLWKFKQEDALAFLEAERLT